MDHNREIGPDVGGWLGGRKPSTEFGEIRERQFVRTLGSLSLASWQQMLADDVLLMFTCKYKHHVIRDLMAYPYIGTMPAVIVL